MHVKMKIHGKIDFLTGHWAVSPLGPKYAADYRRSLHAFLGDHQTGQKLQLEMVDLPFPSRSYRLKVNGQWAKKIPVASKTAVMQQLRAWWVAH